MNRTRIAPEALTDSAFSGRVLTHYAALIFVGLITLSVRTSLAQSGSNLGLFKNYFVTGDYAVGGVALRGLGVNGLATGIIDICAPDVPLPLPPPGNCAPAVPTNADILAAFLYWQTVEDAAVPSGFAGTFRGQAIQGKQIAPVKADGTSLSPSCWSSGGGNGTGSGALNLRVYRADVLRFLPYKIDPSTGEPKGQRW